MDVTAAFDSGRPSGGHGISLEAGSPPGLVTLGPNGASFGLGKSRLD